MTFLELVQAMQIACSEAKAGAALTATAGSLDEKFSDMALEAYRTANTWKRWPWSKGTTTVTELASPLFTVDSTLLEVILATYSGIPLNTDLTYEDLIHRFQTGGNSGSVGAPVYAAMKDFNTLYVYPTPSDTNPAANIEIVGFTEIADPTTDATDLEGPAQYHDAVAQLGYSIAVRKHFGDNSAADKEEARAYRMLQRVATKARRGRPQPRFRT